MNEEEKNFRVIIAGGGTGGHLFPGIAVGKEIAKRFPLSDILFVTAGRDLETQILKRAGFRQESIMVEGIKGKGILGTLKSLFKLPRSLFQSLAVIKKISPDIILGVGGYSSGPLCLSGWLKKVPVAIHEQNSYPGLTNRLLSRVVDRVFISFEESRDCFPSGELLLTGNPVRDEFTKGIVIPAEKDRSFTIFITGGSQGAVAVNTVFLKSLEIMNKRGVRPGVIHHTGQYDYERVVKVYKEKGLDGELIPFIEDMADTYNRADIFIGRAGAGTIFELAATGTPAILIPLPNSANRHQESNARALVNVGGAEMYNQDQLTGEELADRLIGYMNDGSLLVNMSENVRKAAKIDAVEKIVDEMCRLIEKGKQ
ncbi:undecaprenyldiphospho-muramoylpentapeptide beta-N-acetylglucosaminyltransferase [Thermodesulfobacteriota bacterium]